MSEVIEFDRYRTAPPVFAPELSTLRYEECLQRLAQAVAEPLPERRRKVAWRGERPVLVIE